MESEETVAFEHRKEGESGAVTQQITSGRTAMLYIYITTRTSFSKPLDALACSPTRLHLRLVQRGQGFQQQQAV